MIVVETLFWVSALAVLLTYVLYPVSLVVLAVVRRGRRARRESFEPSVSLIISAFNEERVIREKIENSLALDYPRDRLEILVISDASEDATDRIAQEYADRGVCLLRQPLRGGKSQGLTRFVPEAKGEVLVFSDANSMYEPGAILALVRHFADPAVGYVVGCQRYLADGASPASQSENLYWRYEVWLKECESRVGSVVGGDGAIYAIRARLFQPLADHDISDFVNPLQIVAAGYRGVFEKGAVCFEHTAGAFGGEFRRKIRIVNRAFTGLLTVPEVMDPRRVGWFAYQIVAHKLIRWFVPYFLLFLGVTSLWLATGSASLFWRLLVAAQVVCYGMAILGLFPGFRVRRCFYIPYYFCLVNGAALIGTLTALWGKRYVTWRPER